MGCTGRRACGGRAHATACRRAAIGGRSLPFAPPRVLPACWTMRRPMSRPSTSSEGRAKISIMPNFAACAATVVKAGGTGRVGARSCYGPPGWRERPVCGRVSMGSTSEQPALAAKAVPRPDRDRPFFPLPSVEFSRVKYHWSGAKTDSIL